MTIDPTTVVLLAAGHGTRLGQDKATLRLGGETLVQRHIRQARTADPRARIVVVANPRNVDAIRADLAAIDVRAEVILQDGGNANTSAFVGLQQAELATSVFLAGIVDLVPDDTYHRLLTTRASAPLRITTTPLRATFIGGMLDLDQDGTTVRRIIERPPGGCPPGSPANIWIHYINSPDAIHALTNATGRLADYEKAVNHVIASGISAVAVAVPHWVAIKGPDSLDAARQEFGLTTGGTQT
jgi:hypothetical protein